MTSTLYPMQFSPTFRRYRCGGRLLESVLGQAIGEGDDCSFGEFIEDSQTENPVRLATNCILRDRIEGLLKTLTYREREIIRLRYGLGDGYTYTLEEVGRIFKVTRERVRQIEAKAVLKLQNPVRAQVLEGFVPDGRMRSQQDEADEPETEDLPVASFEIEQEAIVPEQPEAPTFESLESLEAADVDSLPLFDMPAG